MNIILRKSLLIFILLLSVFILPLFFPTGIAIYFRLLLLFLIFVKSLKLFKIIFIDHKTNKALSNLGTFLFSLLIIFIILEALFMFIPRSHNLYWPLSSKLWFAKYWSPINSLGFRDHEPEFKKQVILFVGDSYTAGYGLKSVEDRFSNMVGSELRKKKERYSVINIGKNGMDSRGEYDLMRQFIHLTRIKPEKIILQYHGNDIEAAAYREGLYKVNLSILGEEIPIMTRMRQVTDNGFMINALDHRVNIPYKYGFLIFLGSGSYFLNYLYWSFPQDNIYMPYEKFITQAFNNKVVLAKHEDDLRLFVDFAQKNSIKLIVLVFPQLENMAWSDLLYGHHVVNFFKTHHVDVINVSELVKNIPLSERIINQNDRHASAKVNRIIAQEILKKL